MIPEIREWFNQRFTPRHYEHLLAELHRLFPGALDFRVAETPLFIDSAFQQKLLSAGEEIVKIITAPEFLQRMDGAVPREYYLPGEPEHPAFLQIDFALALDDQGEVVPRLIELQGFPTLYCFQHLLGQTFRTVYGLPETFTHFFPDFEEETYVTALRRILLGSHPPEQVVLMDLFPHRQKTRIDFYCTEKLFGVSPVCFTEIQQRKGRLFYRRNNKTIPIRRIYSRLIFDEVRERGIPIPAFWKEPLQVEWIGHPNWYFKLSKYALPFINSECCPRTYFLHQLPQLPDDLGAFVLKPLFSFAGSGVEVDVTPERLRSIKDPEHFILQEKVRYAPVLKTPDGFAKVEFRLMYLWDEKPQPAINLVRFSKGKMMGVDYNRYKEWVGSSIALFVPPEGVPDRR